MSTQDPEHKREQPDKVPQCMPMVIKEKANEEEKTSQTA
jgi:hypothetical protein